MLVLLYIYVSIYTSKVFKQRKQLIWNLKFHADTAAIFSEMNKTLILQYQGIFCIIWRHIKVFAKMLSRVWSVLWKLLEETGSSLCYHMISVHTCFCVCIYLIFRFAYLAYYCLCAMLFSVSHSSIVNIFCCLCYMPGAYLKSPMLCLRCVCCLLFSKTR